MWYAILFVQAIKMASKDTMMSKQCTGGKRQNITLTIPLKLRIIGGSVMAQTEEFTVSQNIGSSTICDYG
jgi:hypothetical protein